MILVFNVPVSLLVLGQAMHLVAPGAAHATEIGHAPAHFLVPFFLLCVTGIADLRLRAAGHNGIFFCVHLVTGRTGNDPLVMGRALEGCDFHALLGTAVAVHAGSDLLIARCGDLRVTEADQRRKPLAAMGPGNVDTGRAVAGFTTVVSEWRAVVLCIAMSSIGNRSHPLSGVAYQAIFRVFTGKSRRAVNEYFIQPLLGMDSAGREHQGQHD